MTFSWVYSVIIGSDGLSGNLLLDVLIPTTNAYTLLHAALSFLSEILDLYIS